MADLVRFGVAMDRGLLRDFDERIAGKGYENRSEALRDLVRADLTRAATEGDAVVAATLTVVHGRRSREALLRALEEEDGAGERHVLSQLRVPLDAARDLEVLVLRGRASQLTALAGRVGGARGVLTAELTIASATAP